ncbi:hypothetical protein HN803_00105 [candidate division WWE3 bacterium]|jgi:hypothetical protein|nr:hypothetical protein [candidate division WWE3 bacterium]
MAQLIYVDADGKETHREVKGRGRPPKGSVKQESGDFIVHPVEDIERQVVDYIDVNEGGDVLTRSSKGRGRPKNGYTKMTDGEHVGHWVKIVSVDAEGVTDEAGLTHGKVGDVALT